MAPPFSSRLFFSVALTVTGFLVSVTVFAMVFKTHFYKPYPEAQTIPEEVPTVDFIAVGDIMLSRLVARRAERGGGPSWIWAHIQDFLQKSDFNIWNLESPANGTSVYSYEETMVFNALPELIHTLPGMNFGVVNLANNHALDQGEAWLTYTRDLLQKIGIEHIGAGTTQEEAWAPKIIEQDGIRIAFVGAAYATYNDDGSRMGPWIARMQNEQRLESSLRLARTQADFVVVNMHGGLEYSRKPTELQTEFARRAIDLGADMVIGGHPHWTQGIESYQGKYIFYSLGNFVFDQEFSPETKTGLAVRVFLRKIGDTTQLAHVELHPIIIENYGQPRLLSWEAKMQALRDIWQLTDTLY